MIPTSSALAIFSIFNRVIFFSKVSAQPNFGYISAVQGVEIYSPSNSVDFELPEHYYTELVVEIAQMIGINLRDADVAQYAAVEKQKEESK